MPTTEAATVITTLSSKPFPDVAGAGDEVGPGEGQDEAASRGRALVDPRPVHLDRGDGGDKVDARTRSSAPSAARRGVTRGGLRQGVPSSVVELGAGSAHSAASGSVRSVLVLDLADRRLPVLLAVDRRSARRAVSAVGRAVEDDLADAQADDALHEHLRQRHVVDVDDRGQPAFARKARRSAA